MTYVALMFGAIYAKEIEIEINEDVIQKAMQIEEQSQRELANDPAFQQATGQLAGDTMNEIVKADAKLITH